MISLLDFQEILGITFFDGNYEIAGIVIFVAALALMFVFIKNKGNALILALPITMVFTMLGILSSDVTVLLIIVISLALAFNAKKVF